ncbi:MAG: hypothetical protein OMM_09153 [Candidatus Magnetoglobus multicellularis str. Araruama]|uniref:CHAT domain-containing protein n=1 Tax=Candidatus Magnetoglobus multicellularis str. Araruama TaxID=890399 RepID=A0A1V1P518_9BACT|nr:MAG: hypothetical protein OMM_09153 [Candidatus Magnetoglobus multicellularis str. Araruama]
MKNSEYAILHVATHGFFNAESNQSYLVAYDDRLTLDGLENIVQLTRFHKQPVELLTLSACETALGDERAALGLAGIALKAGVKSAIATLWAIEERSSSVVMTEFYRELLNKEFSKAMALRNSQIKAIKNTDYSHPFYWAPFLLIGNWM